MGLSRQWWDKRADPVVKSSVTRARLPETDWGALLYQDFNGDAMTITGRTPRDPFDNYISERLQSNPQVAYRPHTRTVTYTATTGSSTWNLQTRVSLEQLEQMYEQVRNFAAWEAPPRTALQQIQEDMDDRMRTSLLYEAYRPRGPLNPGQWEIVENPCNEVPLPSLGDWVIEPSLPEPEPDPGHVQLDLF